MRVHVLCSGAFPSGLTAAPKTLPTPQCINNWHRRHGYTSSLELPDNILNFIKKHPLMEEQVRPRWGRPLLVKKNANLTHLVADRVSGLDGATYTVLFIGTGGYGRGSLRLGEGLRAQAGRSRDSPSPGPCCPFPDSCSPLPLQETAGCSRP